MDYLTFLSALLSLLGSRQIIRVNQCFLTLRTKMTSMMIYTSLSKNCWVVFSPHIWQNSKCQIRWTSLVKRSIYHCTRDEKWIIREIWWSWQIHFTAHMSLIRKSDENVVPKSIPPSHPTEAIAPTLNFCYSSPRRSSVFTDHLFHLDWSVGTIWLGIHHKFASGML